MIGSLRLLPSVRRLDSVSNPPSKDNFRILPKLVPVPIPPLPPKKIVYVHFGGMDTFIGCTNPDDDIEEVQIRHKRTIHAAIAERRLEDDSLFNIATFCGKDIGEESREWIEASEYDEVEPTCKQCLKAPLFEQRRRLRREYLAPIRMAMPIFQVVYRKDYQ